MKKQIYALLLVSLAMTQVAFYESGLVGDNGKTLLIVKLTAVAALLALIAWAWIKKVDSLAFKICVAAVFAYYPAASSLFRPWYVLAVLQLAIIYAFFFEAKPKLYWSYLSVAIFSFYIPFWLRWPDVPENHVRLERGDWISISVQQAAILFLTYLFVIRARSYQQKTEASFVAIGKHASRVTHDLKGMLSAPLLYLDHAHAVLGSLPLESAHLSDAVSRTQRQLADLHLAVSELSRLTTTEALPITRFLLGDCIHSTALLFGRELAIYNYDSAGAETALFKIEADRSLVAAVVFEIFSAALVIARSGSHPPSPPLLPTYFRWEIEKDEQLATLHLRHPSLPNSNDVTSWEDQLATLKTIANSARTSVEIQRTDVGIKFRWALGKITVAS